MFYDDCGFRDQRDADRHYGRCPDCGDVRSPRCHCDVADVEPPPPTPEELAAYEAMKDGEIPF